MKLNDTKSKIVKFYVGLTPAYIVVGPKNVQKVLGSPHELDGNWLQLMLMAGHWDMSNDEIAKFANDNSGRGIAPAPGAEGIPAEKRYWHMHDRLYLDFLAKQKYSDALARSFNSLFVERLDHQPKDEWTTVGLLSMLKTTMAESAIISLFGSKIIELNPGFIKTYWKLDDIAGNLVWGLPKFMQRTSVAIRERMHSMTEKHINEAWEHFDWDGTDEETEWEPHFGSRLSRETAKWFRENGFSNHAAAGHTLGSLVGFVSYPAMIMDGKIADSLGNHRLNGNTVPVTTWAMIEAIRDPELFQALREEALAAYEIDPTTGENRINAQKLVKMPLMQSLYVEIMRMHVSFNPTRMAKNTVEIDGYKVKKGALVQTCSRIAHYEDAIWGTVEHPASEFWAYRNTKVIETVDESTGEVKSQLQFGMKGRPSSFFPYGTYTRSLPVLVSRKFCGMSGMGLGADCFY